MRVLKVKKKRTVVFILEIVITIIFILRCFGYCTEYTLNKEDFKKSFDGDLIYFDDGSVGIETQGSEEAELMNCLLDLGSGAYNVKVIYNSVSNYDTINIDNCVGKIVFETDNARILRASEIQLRDGLSEIQSRFWLRKGDGVKLSVRYYGNGKLAIQSVLIEEKREYRIIVCLTVILLILMCNLFYMCFLRKDGKGFTERKKFTVVGIIGITLFSSMAYFSDFLYVGHDLHFHLSRIVSLAKGLEEFRFPHRMQFEMLNGYGYATPLYYGELFLILPAVLYNLYLPLQTCYQVFVVCVNLATAVTGYWCFMKMSQDWKKGLLGAFIYTSAAYRLTDVMVRAAVGEYTALIFFPLLIYGFWVIYNKSDDEKIIFTDCMPVIFAATGIINSHILSCEMLLVFIVLFVVISYKKTFKGNIFAALVKSAIFSVLLNIWFIFPFFQSMGMRVNVSNNDFVSRIEGHVLIFRRCSEFFIHL